MSSILSGILRQKLLEIQNQLPPYVKIIKDNPPSFEDVLNKEINEQSDVQNNYGGDYSHLIKVAAKKYNINENIITAVMKAESGFDPTAVSRTGAMGLMQLMPETAKILGVQCF